MAPDRPTTEHTIADNRKAFHDYEAESYRNIQALLDTSVELPREVFEFLLKKIYKRSK